MKANFLMRASQIQDGLLIGIAWLIRIWFVVLVVQFVWFAFSHFNNPSPL